MSVDISKYYDSRYDDVEYTKEGADMMKEKSELIVKLRSVLDSGCTEAFSRIRFKTRRKLVENKINSFSLDHLRDLDYMLDL